MHIPNWHLHPAALGSAAATCSTPLPNTIWSDVPTNITDKFAGDYRACCEYCASLGCQRFYVSPEGCYTYNSPSGSPTPGVQGTAAGLGARGSRREPGCRQPA